jgi:hypothetical protein
MKISTNSFGNYNPVNNLQKKNPANFQTRKELTNIKVTKEEKQFFTKLYPEDKENIDSYHFYNKQGDKKGVSLGSIFDKRG